MSEYFDLLDERGEKTGVIKERALVHRDGDLHGTAHVWILRSLPEGCAILLQKRSPGKDAYPGCWDISSAGHLPSGSGYLEIALRELQEELGLSVPAEELVFAGFHQRMTSTVFHGVPFRDQERSAVYLLCRGIEPASLRLQREEVSEVRYFPVPWILAHFQDPSFPHCLQMDELKLVIHTYKSIEKRSHL